MQNQIDTSNEVPLIYTSKGNLPIADLEYHQFWSEDENCIICNEEYYLAGELVKSNRHVKLKQGLQALLEQGAIGNG